MTWTLTQPAFDRMLAMLDADRMRAAEKYESIRHRLVKFFEWRGCTDPLTYTDRTMDRVARRLNDGADLSAVDPYFFFHGVAVNVLREHWRAPERALSPIDDLPADRQPREDPEPREAARQERLVHERRLACLDRCLNTLPPESRELVAHYHLDSGERRMDVRRALAASLGIPLNALRIRVFRLRQALERCVASCMREAGAP